MNGDELAAVVMALQQLAAAAQNPPPASTVWKLAMLEPDLSVDDLRATARGSRSVW